MNAAGYVGKPQGRCTGEDEIQLWLEQLSIDVNTWRYNPESHNLHAYHQENLKYYKVVQI
jgi:hypothetical protein